MNFNTITRTIYPKFCMDNKSTITFDNWNITEQNSKLCSPFGTRSTDLILTYHIPRFIQFVVGFGMNTLTCIIIVKDKYLRTGSNMLLLNIALSDIMSSLVAPLTMTVGILEHFYKLSGWKELCYLTTFLALTGK